MRSFRLLISYYQITIIIIKLNHDELSCHLQKIILTYLLQIADLLLLFVAAPMDMVHYFARDFDIDGGACKVAEYSRVLSAVASIMNLLAVTIER